jgi:rubrerythrin
MNDLDFNEMYIDLKNTKATLQVVEDRLNMLMVDLHNIKIMVEDICDSRHNRIKIPHRCPICNAQDSPNLCTTCDSTGIVWG